MTVNVKTIPSINTPLTDKEGRMNPVWHSFLRSFVAASANGTISSSSTTGTVTAGSGLTGGGTGDITLAVGAGQGISVDADQVNVDIHDQTRVNAALDDEVLINDISDNNSIRKTTVRDIASFGGTVPAGNSGEMQYNNSGFFGADSGTTTDGAGTVSISTALTVATNTKITNSGGIGIIRFDGSTGNSPRVVTDGSGGYSFYASLPGGWANNANLYFRATSPNPVIWNFDTNNTITMDNSNSTNTGVQFNGKMALSRCMHSSITASTTQTQGNGALTGDYNNVTTVANANDTVTLPEAFRSRFCLVRNAGANVLQVFPASGDDLGAGANTATTIRPGEHFIWFAIDTTTWHQVAGVMRHTVKSGITASTTQTQGQQPLTMDVNEVSTVANANDVVTLPTAPSYSRTVTIINNGANTLQIFPASGDNLGAGVNTSTTLASGSNVRYTNYDSTNWEAI